MGLDFIDIIHDYGATRAVANASLTAAPGKITCLLGPSGCGKTTLLRLAAGLSDVQQGEIHLDGTPLATPSLSPPPEARDVGLVFQEGALFPHMTIARNIAFGLRRHPNKDNIVNAVLSQLGLEGFAERYPHTLSGGQQQRVALGRAMAPEPRVLLLDEPFANLDILRRRALREETRRALKNRHCITILVTHDPEEAMEVADHIAVMDNGHIVQCGTPAEVFDSPVSASIGAMFGGGQIIVGQRHEDGITTPFGLWSPDKFNNDVPGGAHLDVLVRPNSVTVSAGGHDGTIDDIRVFGDIQKLLITAATGEHIWTNVPRAFNAEIGANVGLEPRPASIFAFAPG